MIKEGQEMDKETMATSTDGRKFPYRVYKAVAAYRGLQLDEYVMDIIDASTKEEVLNDYLEWNGIIGYTCAIMSIINA